MKEDSRTSLGGWYERSQSSYDGLVGIVRSTLESLIKSAKIDFLSVTGRTKSLDSFREKVERKGYSDSNQITDLAGIRVITFIESDAARVCDLIESSFTVHPESSLDKAGELGIDRSGYRSVHFVCDLGKTRTTLPEFALYKDMLFEIQVRTALQHAWAEIEHDRNYKLSGVLPTPLQRRLYLLAGVLEIVDREFAAIAGEIDTYSAEVAEKTKAGDLDIEINSTSIWEYLPTRIRNLPKINVKPLYDTRSLERVVGELRDFGITRLESLDALLSKAFADALQEIDIEQETTAAGLMRKAMIFEDVDRYFGDVWRKNWSSATASTRKLIENKYGKEKLKEIDTLLHASKSPGRPPIKRKPRARKRNP